MYIANLNVPFLLNMLFNISHSSTPTSSPHGSPVASPRRPKLVTRIDSIGGPSEKKRVSVFDQGSQKESSENVICDVRSGDAMDVSSDSSEEEFGMFFCAATFLSISLIDGKIIVIFQV